MSEIQNALFSVLVEMGGGTTPIKDQALFREAAKKDLLRDLTPAKMRMFIEPHNSVEIYRRRDGTYYGVKPGHITEPANPTETSPPKSGPERGPPQNTHIVAPDDVKSRLLESRENHSDQTGESHMPGHEESVDETLPLTKAVLGAMQEKGGEKLRARDIIDLVRRIMHNREITTLNLGHHMGRMFRGNLLANQVKISPWTYYSLPSIGKPSPTKDEAPRSDTTKKTERKKPGPRTAAKTQPKIRKAIPKTRQKQPDLIDIAIESLGMRLTISQRISDIEKLANLIVGIPEDDREKVLEAAVAYANTIG